MVSYLCQRNLILLRLRELPAKRAAGLQDQTAESEGVQDDQQDKGDHAHEDEVEVDAVDL